MVYKPLEGSFDIWQAMQQEFLRQFCNTQRCASASELIETKQREN